MIKRKCCPELVQIHGFRSVEVLLDTPPGSLKNSPEAKEAEVLSKSRSVQSTPVKSLIRFWPSALRSTSCLSPRTLEEEHEVTRAQVPILSPKSGLGTRFGLVALGKDDRIAWSWTLGPPSRNPEAGWTFVLEPGGRRDFCPGTRRLVELLSRNLMVVWTFKGTFSYIFSTRSRLRQLPLGRLTDGTRCVRFVNLKYRDASQSTFRRWVTREFFPRDRRSLLWTQRFNSWILGSNGTVVLLQNPKMLLGSEGPGGCFEPEGCSGPGGRLGTQRFLLDPGVILNPEVSFGPGGRFEPGGCSRPGGRLGTRRFLLDPQVVLNPKVVLNPEVALDPEVVWNPEVVLNPNVSFGPGGRFEPGGCSRPEGRFEPGVIFRPGVRKNPEYLVLQGPYSAYLGKSTPEGAGVGVMTQVPDFAAFHVWKSIVLIAPCISQYFYFAFVLMPPALLQELACSIRCSMRKSSTLHYMEYAPCLIFSQVGARPDGETFDASVGINIGLSVAGPLGFRLIDLGRFRLLALHVDWTARHIGLAGEDHLYLLKSDVGDLLPCSEAGILDLGFALQ
ncbi:hypothetical protein F2Q70_00011375 [Brassica cretica]|uniref:Uncharacterized protein n=1 Tax=Brassica cretica TaxID=69181 RepID=A0A8S9M2C3_BRACR|nr:hypothetical protein F2Q70_00011375 [Brassica cretica]